MLSGRPPAPRRADYGDAARQGICWLCSPTGPFGTARARVSAECLCLTPVFGLGSRAGRPPVIQ
jgi:hypothetical protein